MAIENLMRASAPKIIIATLTLGQGVNIGISTVIIARPSIGENHDIDKRDFWNICGRAGRAFVDGEGKILYAIDEDFSKIDSNREKNPAKSRMQRTRKKWQVEKDTNLANEYFDISKLDRVESGLLYVINILRHVAEEASISFDILIELVANNEFELFGEKQPLFEEILDLLDDELLALHEDSSVNISIDDSVDWIDQAFRESLAMIQARAGVEQSTTEDVIRFLKARTKSTLMRVPDKATRKAIVASGLPLSVSIQAHKDLDVFRTLADKYLQSDRTVAELSSIVQSFEEWVRANGSSITHKMPEESKLNVIRSLWLGGISLQKITEKEPDAAFICKDFYGYKLPWIIHAITQKLDKTTEEDRFNALSLIALIVEIGVPTELAANIFLAGIHSRAAATELSILDIQFGSSVSTISSNLYNPEFAEVLIPLVSPSTAEWLSLMLSDESHRKIPPPRFAPFALRDTSDIDILYARTSSDSVVLCSLDGRTKIRMESTINLPFEQMADDPRFVFEKIENIWHLIVRDPRCM
jgi:hypothetical protein